MHRGAAATAVPGRGGPDPPGVGVGADANGTNLFTAPLTNGTAGAKSAFQHTGLYASQDTNALPNATPFTVGASDTFLDLYQRLKGTLLGAQGRDVAVTIDYKSACEHMLTLLLLMVHFDLDREVESPAISPLQMFFPQQTEELYRFCKSLLLPHAGDAHPMPKRPRPVPDEARTFKQLKDILTFHNIQNGLPKP